MSLVFGSREVSMGPSMGLQGEREQRGISGCFSDYLNRKGDVEEEKGKEVAASGEPVKRVNGFCFGGEDLESSESSSIGVPDESDEEEEEVQSGLKSGGGALSSLDALEESLPIKRGLSNFFPGRSKSFANLTDVSILEGRTSITKKENPWNKRRRTLMAFKWDKRLKKSFYSSSNPTSMPLLPLNEDEEDETKDQNQLGTSINKKKNTSSNSSEDSDDTDYDEDPPLRRKFRSFKSASCLTDLQHHP